MGNDTIYSIGILSFTITDKTISVYVKKEVEPKLALPLFAKQCARNIELIVNARVNVPDEQLIQYIEHVYYRECTVYGGNLMNTMKKDNA